jgi:hypothetical protein
LLTDLEAADLFAQEWQHHLDEQVEHNPGVPMHEWRSAGRRSKQYPDKENATWWLDHGPGMVKRYAEWIAEMESFGWNIWTAPGGVPGVEIELYVHFGQTPVRMGIDRLLVSPQSELAVVDLKTGGRTPESDLQLGFYACGMELAGLPRPTYGAYWMARKGELTTLVNLDHFTVESITDELDQFNRAIEQRVFLPKRGNHCISCGVRFACAAMKGEQAHLFDPSHPDYQGRD